MAKELGKIDPLYRWYIFNARLPTLSLNLGGGKGSKIKRDIRLHINMKYYVIIKFTQFTTRWCYPNRFFSLWYGIIGLSETNIMVWMQSGDENSKCNHTQPKMVVVGEEGWEKPAPPYLCPQKHQREVSASLDAIRSCRAS